MAVEVKLGGASTDIGAPRALFTFPPTPNTNYWFYDATADGQKFLFLDPVETRQQPISLVVDWPELLKK